MILPGTGSPRDGRVPNTESQEGSGGHLPSLQGVHRGAAAVEVTSSHLTVTALLGGKTDGRDLKPEDLPVLLLASSASTSKGVRLEHTYDRIVPSLYKRGHGRSHHRRGQRTGPRWSSPGPVSGEQTSYLVVDFATTGGDAYAFGYHWNDTSTVLDMLIAVSSSTELVALHV